MNLGILGTGPVARTLGTGFVQAGHHVRLGARSATHDAASTWAADHGAAASHGTFADAAAFGEIVLLCVPGEHALAALQAAGDDALRGKVLIDVSNPLDFSRGFPPRLTHVNDTSLAETLQAAFPDVRFVKALNTVAAELMVNPGLLPEATDLLICGDDAEAKSEVRELLSHAFGWQRFTDVGPLSGARGTEAWLLLWTRLYGTMGHARFNLRLVREGDRS